MTLEALGRPSFQRAVLAVVVIADLISFFFFLGEARAHALAEGIALGAFAELLSRPITSGLLIVIGVAAAAVFGWKAGRLWAGLVALVVLALLSTAHAQLFGSPWRHLYYSGLCLSGWLLGLAVSRRRGAPEDESYALTGSTALLAAAYLNGGISKLAFGGLDWSFGLPIQAIVVGQDGLVADDLVSAYRSWVVTVPIAAGLFSFVTIALELVAPLMIVGGRIRAVIALGLIAMHLNILVLTHILYWEALVFLALFGLLQRDPPVQAFSDSSPAILVRSRAFMITVVLLALCALVGIGRQSRRFVSWQDTSPRAVEPSRQAPPTISGSPAVDDQPAPPAGVSRQIGPFTIGQSLIAGWSVDAFELTADGFVAMLQGGPGRARFEVTCAVSTQRSPFDLGAAHIFYSKDVAFDDLEDVGAAFRERLRAAAGEQEICDRLQEWRAAAGKAP